MAGAGITIDVDDAELKHALGKLQKFVKSGLQPTMDEIGARLEMSTLRRFETETAPSGEPWERSQAADRRGRPGSDRRRGQTLTASGRLRDSITRFVSGDSVVVGTNVEYAAIHQFGGKTPPRTIRPKTKKALSWPGAAHPVAKVEHPGSKMPERAFLGVSSGDEKAIVAIIDARVGEAWSA